MSENVYNLGLTGAEVQSKLSAVSSAIEATASLEERLNQSSIFNLCIIPMTKLANGSYKAQISKNGYTQMVNSGKRPIAITSDGEIFRHIYSGNQLSMSDYKLGFYNNKLSEVRETRLIYNSDQADYELGGKTTYYTIFSKISLSLPLQKTIPSIQKSISTWVNNVTIAAGSSLVYGIIDPNENYVTGRVFVDKSVPDGVKMTILSDDMIRLVNTSSSDLPVSVSVITYSLVST